MSISRLRKVEASVVPELTPLGEAGQYDIIQNGTDLSIPYAYVDSTGVPSFTVYYRTDEADDWVAQSSNSFNTRTPGKFYVEIGADRYLNKEYIEYYLEAENTFHAVVTPVHTVTVENDDTFTGLRSNLSDGDTVSGTVDIVGRSGDNAAVSIAIDGVAVDSTRRLEKGAWFTMDITGLDGRKNAILANGELVEVFSRWYNILSSRAILIDNSFMNFNPDGSADITIRIVAGTEIDALDTSAGTAPDNFSMTNFHMVLPDGTVLEPDGSVSATDNVTLNTSKRTVELHFTVPAGSMNANGMVWDTTKVSDGSHSLIISSGGNDKEIQVNVDNTAPIIHAEVPDHVNGLYSFSPTYTDASSVAEDTLMLELDGTLLDGVSFNGSELQPGTHTLTASVEDAIGNTGTQTWTFTSSENYPAFSSVSSSNVDSRSATLTADLSHGEDVQVSFHTAKALTVGNGITVYQGSGDSTAAAVTGAIGTVASENGNLPYQMYEINVEDTDTSLKLSLEAATDYGKDVRLYVRSSDGSKWNLLDSHYEDGKITSVFETGNYINGGKVYVLAQGRGIEMLPVTTASRPATVANEYVWDGNGEPEQYDFSIAWTTDTQYYAERYPANFELLNRYIADSKDRMDIRYVVNTGDLVDDIDELYQWEYADQYMKILEDAGLPYGVLAGNHDIANHNARYDMYQSYFGKDRFEGNTVHGGSYKDNLGHYDLVTAGGQDMIFVYMSYDFDHSAVEWMNEVLSNYPDRMAILGFHNYTNKVGELDAAGLYFQEAVVAANPNVAMVLNGHYHGAAIQVTGYDDDQDGTKERSVYQILTDYQSGEEGGNAYYVTLYFDMANDKLYMNAYSPKLDDFSYFDADKLPSYGQGLIANELDVFELDLDFDTAPKTMTVSAIEAVLYDNTALGAQYAEDHSASISVDRLASGTNHTWLAIAANSAGIAYSELSTFTTQGDGSGGNDGSDNDEPSDETANDTSDSSSKNDILFSNQGDTTKSTVTVTGSEIRSGKVTVSVDAQTATALAAAALSAEQEGRKAIVEIKVESNSTAAAVEVTIPREAFSSLVTGTSAKLIVDVGTGTINFDAAALDAIHAGASTGDFTFSVDQTDTSELSDEVKERVGDRKVYDFTVNLGSTTISDFGGGSVNINLPYTRPADEDPNAIVVYYISDTGELQLVQGQYNTNTSLVEFTTTHFSQYTVGYNKITFNDVIDTDWYHDAVTFLAAREVTNGTGNGEFSPNATLTRGQFIVMLMRAYGIESSVDNKDNFSDAGNTYYSNYLATAKQLNIANGIGDNQFAPDHVITREEVFTLLYRALDVLGGRPVPTGSKTVSDFSDVGLISNYAQEALNSLVEAGIITGSDGKLNPTATSTRAEMAQVLYNLLSK